MLYTLALAPLLVATPPQDLPQRPVVVAGEVGAMLDGYLERCAAFGFSGAVLVRHGGELVLRKGYGIADSKTGAANTPETLYDIASASKQVTAAAILLLEERGELSTQDSIAEHLPGVPEEDLDVTIDHLLRHTSGFPRYGPSGGGADLEGAVRGYTSRGRSAEPGTKFDYWNGGYALLAGVVETVAGEPFEDWVRANLFEPAGLLHTDFTTTGRVAHERMARTHEDGGRRTDEYIGGWGYRGMGGVLTSVSDLGRWVLAILAEDTVLSEDSRAKLIEPGLGKYGRGWYVLETARGTRVVQHGGTAPGFQSYIRYFIDEDTLTLVTTNREGMHWQVAWGLEALLFDGEPKVPGPPAVEAWTDAQTARLVGTWKSKKGGRLFVSKQGAGFVVHAQGTDAIAALTGDDAGGDVAWEEQHAKKVLSELVKGKTDTLGDVLQPSIPRGWMKVLTSTIWPQHVEAYGALLSTRPLGAVKGRGSVKVWIGLEHEDAQRAVRIEFFDRKLGILDLKAGRFPMTRFYAPASPDHLETYRFAAEGGPALSLVRDELRIGSGRSIVRFERAGD